MGKFGTNFENKQELPKIAILIYKVENIFPFSLTAPEIMVSRAGVRRKTLLQNILKGKTNKTL